MFFPCSCLLIFMTTFTDCFFFLVSWNMRLSFSYLFQLDVLFPFFSLPLPKFYEIFATLGTFSSSRAHFSFLFFHFFFIDKIAALLVSWKFIYIKLAHFFFFLSFKTFLFFFLASNMERNNELHVLGLVNEDSQL